MRCITELFNKQNKQKMSKTILLGKKKQQNMVESVSYTMYK